MTTKQITAMQGSFGWTDIKALDSTCPQQEEERSDPFLSIERIQALSDKVKSWGYQLIYDDSNTCRWCIADISGDILWRNFGIYTAVSRLEQQVKNS